MKKLLILLLFATPAWGQSTNWGCGQTAIGGDPLNSSYFSAGSTTGTTTAVGVSDSLAKYLQTNTTVPVNKGIYFCAGKGEFADAQIHYVNTTGSDVTLDYVIGDLTCSTGPNCGSPHTITASTNATVFGERYYKVNTVSETDNSSNPTNLTICPTTTAQAANCFVPDPLVPKVDFYTSQTTNQFPMTVHNNNTGSMFLDELVPAGAPSGYYSGTFTVKVNGSTLCTLPIVLGVWNFSLPSTSSIPNQWQFVLGDPAFAFYGGYGGCNTACLTNFQLQAQELMLDHRISIGTSLVYPGVTNGGGWTGFESSYGGMLNGTTPNTMLTNPHITQINTVPGEPPNGSLSNADAQYWVNEFTAKYTLAQLISYACDEPDGGAMGDMITKWTNCATAAAVGDSSSPILPQLVTTNVTCAGRNYASSSPTPLTYINWMITTDTDFDGNPANCYSGDTSTFNLHRSDYNTWLSGTNKHFGMYPACSNSNTCGDYSIGTPAAGGHHSGYPQYAIDADGVRNRTQQWLCFFMQCGADLYYETGIGWVGSNGADNGAMNGGCTNDPWVCQYYAGVNGDGTLLYPGTNAKIGTTNPVILPSLRLKNIRDGFQDYEYMVLLTSQGQSSLITSSFNDMNFTAPYGFNNCNPSSSGFTGCNFTGGPDQIGCTHCLMAERNAMGNELHALSLGGGATPNPFIFGGSATIKGAATVE